MNDIVRDKAAIVGIGRSQYGRFLPECQLKLGATAFKGALADSGLERSDIDPATWELMAEVERLR